jgi:CRP/FNR family transcriptional regulator, cyclic AMP receptor protein
MPDEQLQRFSREYRPGAEICREGQVGDEMYIIQKGKVRVSKSFAGRTNVVSVLEKGDFFGEMAIVNRIQRTATVTAIDDVELLVFDRDGLQNLVARNPKIAMTIIDKLCRRLQSANIKIQHLVRKDARGLIALHLRYVFQELPGSAPSVPYAKVLGEISSSLELPMDVVRVTIGQMVADGVFSVGEDALNLSDREKLLSVTEGVGGEPGESGRA